MENKYTQSERDILIMYMLTHENEDELKKHRHKTSLELEDELFAFIFKYADDQNITYAQAQRELSREAKTEFNRKLTIYQKEAEKQGYSNSFKREVKRAKRTQNATLLSAMSLIIAHSLEKIAKEQKTQIIDAVSKVYDYSYSHAVYELYKEKKREQQLRDIREVSAQIQKQRNWNELKVKAKQARLKRDKLLHEQRQIELKKEVETNRQIREKQEKAILEKNKQIEKAKIELDESEKEAEHLKKFIEKESKKPELNRSDVIASGIDKRVKALMSETWGEGFKLPKTIDGNADKIRSMIVTTLEDNIKNGTDIKTSIKKIKEQTHAEDYVIARIIRTESARVASIAQFDSYKNQGIKKYKFIATLERNTCVRCGALDQREFVIEKAEPWETVPPIHPNCKCTTIPLDKKADEMAKKGTRAKRDPDTKKTGEVEYQDFEEWIEQYDPKKAELVKEAKRKGDWAYSQDGVGLKEGTDGSTFYEYKTIEALDRNLDSERKSFESKLDEREEKNFTEYTDKKVAEKINSELWKNYKTGEPISEDTREREKIINNAINKFNLKKGIITYRAEHMSNILKGRSLDEIIGTEYPYPALLSTTPHENTGKKFAKKQNKDALIEFRVKPGRGKYAYIKDLSIEKGEENELLFRSGLKFKIVDYEYVENADGVKMLKFIFEEAEG